MDIIKGNGLLVCHEDVSLIFDRTNNPDGLKDKWIALFECFSKKKIKLVTRRDGSPILFELHLNVQESVAKTNKPAYLILLEDPHVYPLNKQNELLSLYKKIFTWDDRLVDGNRFIKITFAPRLLKPKVDGYLNRPNLCCMIAANKSLPVFSDKDLYKERVKLIRWFENYAPDDFVLYGGGWDLPPKLTGKLGSMLHAFCRMINIGNRMVFFPLWQGKVRAKSDVLVNTRFTIAYENVADIPGYITEKIFDAFSFGCVPVYWGANNIEQYVPYDCFIDRKSFKSNQDLYMYMKNMSEEEYIQYQQAILNFYNNLPDRFRPHVFARIICDEVMHDIGR